MKKNPPQLPVYQTQEQYIEPACPHFGSCGGCTLQHIRYVDALAFKQDRIYQLFEPWREMACFYPAIASKKIWQYRNKMEFSFSQNKRGDHFLGLIMSNSRGKVFNLEQCPISPGWMAEAVALCRKFWTESGLLAYNYHKNTGHLRTLTLRESPNTLDRMCILTVSGNADFAIPREILDRFTESMEGIRPPGDGKLSVILRIHQIAKGQKTQVYEMKLSGDDFIRERMTVLGREVEFHISPLAFFQPNTDTAMEIYERALTLAELSADDVVYDLYCGIGSFGLLCAHKVKQVIGIELSYDSAYDAKVNADRLGIQNFTIIRGDVGAVLQSCMEGRQEIPKPDCILLDPPRCGLEPKALKEVLALGAKKIVYVSCNPETQAQNIQVMTASGYRLHAIQPVDQFPQTLHMENIAILFAESV